MASYDAATAVNAYMGPFAPAAWRAAHASVAGRTQVPGKSALPPYEMTQCPFCFIVIASFPSAPRPTTKAYATMLARIESHLLGHAAAATPSSSKFCAPCHLLIPAAQATAHARCPPHLLKLRHVVAPAMLAGGAASAHPLPPASPPRASAAQLPGPGHPPPDQESPPPPPPPFDDDAGAFSPPPSPGLTLGPPPALEPPVETPVSFVGPRCLTGRGATTGATDGVIGRVVVGAFGDSGVAARFCIYAWNAGTRMVGMFNMDRALCLADARKLDADKKDADDAAADRLLDMDDHWKDAIYDKRAKTFGGDQLSYKGATLAVPLSFFTDKVLEASLGHVHESHYPYLRFVAKVVARTTNAKKMNEQTVHFLADDDVSGVANRVVHTHLRADSVFKPPGDLEGAFRSYSDSDSDHASGDEGDEGDEGDDDVADADTGGGGGGSAAAAAGGGGGIAGAAACRLCGEYGHVARKCPCAANAAGGDGGGGDTHGRIAAAGEGSGAVARPPYASDPAVVSLPWRVVSEKRIGWLPPGHVLLDDLTHPRASDARCSVCGGANDDANNGDYFKWCSGRFPAGRGPEFRCHRGLVCPACAGRSATQDRVLATLGITQGLLQAAALWMAKSSVTFVGEERERLLWKAAFRSIEQVHWDGRDPLKSLPSDWVKLRGTPKHGEIAALAETFRQRVLVKADDHTAVVLYATLRCEAIEAYRREVAKPGSSWDEGHPMAVWLAEEQRVESYPALKKVRERAVEARRYFDRQDWLCRGCSNPRPSSVDVWGPLQGKGAFREENTAEGVRAIRGPLRYPACMRDRRPWSEGMYVPSEEIKRRSVERTEKVKELLNRERKPLSEKHITAAELISTYAVDARLAHSNINLLLKLFEDLKTAGVISAGHVADGQLPLVPKKCETLRSRAVLGDKISRSTVKVTVEHFDATGIGQLQAKASLVAVDNGLIALQEMFNDDRLEFLLERPSAANGRPAPGDTGPEFIRSQQCWDAWQSVPAEFDRCFMLSLWSDKTDVQAAGGAQYPLMMKVMNMLEKCFTRRCATRILALLPKIKHRLTHRGKAVRKSDYQTTCERQLLHDAIAETLLPLNHAAENGFWLDIGSGRLVRCTVRVVAYPADIEEKKLLAGMFVGDHCAECLGPTRARILGLERPLLQRGSEYSCCSAARRTTEAMLASQQKALQRGHLGNASAAKAASRAQGMMTHVGVRSAVLAMPQLFPASIGGFHGTLVVDLLHVFKIGLIEKFFRLVLPLVYLYYRKHDGGDDPRDAVKSTEDVQHLIERRLAAVPAMRDGVRRSQSLEQGWWTKSYWMGDDWVTFMSAILFALGQDGDLITDDGVRRLVLRTLRMLFKIYKLVTQRPAKYSAAYLAALDDATKACLAGLEQMQAILERGGRTEVEKQQWKEGANTIKAHMALSLAKALLKLGAETFSSSAVYEAQQAILKQGISLLWSTTAAHMVPVDLLINCYVNQARGDRTPAAPGGVHDELDDVDRTRVFDPDVGRAGKSWATACSLLKRLHETSGSSLRPSTLAGVVANCLGMAGVMLDALSFASCVALPNAISTAGGRLPYVKLVTGECVLVCTDDGTPERYSRFIVAIGESGGGDPSCIVQEFSTVVDGEELGDRDPWVGLPYYRLSETFTQVPGSSLRRMEHMVPRGDGVFWHSRGVWHIGTRSPHAVPRRAVAFEDAKALLPSPTP